MTRPDDLDSETPEADAAEQAAYADPGADENQAGYASDRIDVPEWDALEQAQAIPLEDEYR